MLQGNIHLNIKPVRRAMGQSLVACLAYQLGIGMHDPRTGEWHNYDYKHPEVGGTRLIAPHIEIDNLDYIKKFWSNVELHHKRKDSVPGRRMSIALPGGLSIPQMHQLMWMYACWMRDKYGVAVQITGHKLESENPHFHMYISACAVSADGVLGKKVEALDPIRVRQIDKTAVTQVEAMRERWAEMVNAACAKYEVQVNVDHRSYKRRGIDKIPQKHEGVWRHSKNKHFSSCPIDYNKNIKITNEVLYEHRENSHGIAGGSVGLEKNEPSGMDRDEKRIAEYHTAPERIGTSSQQIVEGSGSDEIGKEAGRALPGSAGFVSSDSVATAQGKQEPSLDETLWALIVKHAERQSADLSRVTRMLNACLEIYTLFPKLKRDHFAMTLKKHSVRTPEEQAHIIAELTRRLEQRGAQQAVVEIAAATATGDMPRVAHNREPIATPPPPQEAQVVQPTPPLPDRVLAAPSVQRIDLRTPRPETQKSTTTSSTPAQPIKQPAGESLFNIGRKGRSMLDKIIALHNLPADTKDEHLKNITDACITLWEHNPKFSFKIIEEVISQKLLLRYDQEKVLDAVRLCRSKAKTEVNEAVPVQSKASPIDPHVPTADNGDGDDNDENAQALTIQHI